MKPSLQRSLSQSSTSGPSGGRRTKQLSGQNVNKSGAQLISLQSVNYTQNMRARYFSDGEYQQVGSY